MTQSAHPSDLESSHPRRGGGPKLRLVQPGEREELPHSIEAEEFLLSCILLDGPDVLPRCQAAHITAASFYDTKHGTVYAEIESLYREGKPIDVAIVAERLKTAQKLEQIGGYAFLTQVSARLPTTAQATFYIETVRDYAVRRTLIRGCETVISGVRTSQDGGADLAQRIEVHTGWLSRQLDILRAGSATMLDSGRAAYQRTMDKLAGKPDTTRWLFTGLHSFDERFGPFDANNEDWFVVIGAFQGGAKSSFKRCVLLNNLRAGKTAHVFLLETGIGKLLELLACTASDIPSHALAQLPADLRAKYQRALDEMHGYLGKTLFVCDEVIPVETLIARIDDHARKQGRPCDAYWVDHMHLLNSIKPHGKREAEMGYIAKQLARCGKRHNRTIFALAQLNRSARADGKNTRPEPHNLRDSGEIEQAARRIVLLHTPDTDMRGTEQTKNQDQVMMEIYQAKHNNGSAGYREAWFRRSITKFFDIGAKESAVNKAATAMIRACGVDPAAPTATTKASFKNHA